jgi:hypothetical protein
MLAQPIASALDYEGNSLLHCPLGEWIMTEARFEHDSSFAQSKDQGNMRVGRFERMYEELFSEVIEDGVITAEERKRLEKMADNFGLDRGRLRKLEQALEAAYSAQTNIAIRDVAAEADDAGPQSLVPLEPATDQRTLALQRRVQMLEARVLELERELDDARLHVAVEVDLSEVKTSDDHAKPAERVRNAPVDEAEIRRQLRMNPRNVEALEMLFTTLPNTDLRKLPIAHALEFLGASNTAAKSLVEQDRSDGLIRPTSALSREAWQTLLYHPDTEPLIGEIFGVVASAVMLGRMSALRRDKALEKLPVETLQDPATTTLLAVRSAHWAASILGLSCPPIHIEPKQAFAMRVGLAIPPGVLLGNHALSGRTGPELAFMAGRHLAYHREEHFLKILLPTMRGLEDVFLASLSIGNPGLPLNSHVRALVVPIAKAIEPLLEPAQVDRLRGHFLRFVELGGRANLLKWSTAVDRTCTRAGFLLSGDLRAASTVLSLEDPKHANEHIDDLLSFIVSEQLSSLKKQIGLTA